MKTFAYIVELAVGKAFFVDLASPKTIAPRTAKNGHSMNSCKGRKEPEATNCCLNTFPTLQSTHPLPITIATRTTTHLHPKPKYGSEQFGKKQKEEYCQYSFLTQQQNSFLVHEQHTATRTTSHWTTAPTNYPSHRPQHNLDDSTSN